MAQLIEQPSADQGSFCSSGGQFLGLLEPVAVCLDVDHLGAVNEAIDQRDDAGSMREHFAPLRERRVGAAQAGP